MKAINRLSQYIEAKGIIPKDFEETCDLSNGYIGKQLRVSGSIGSDIIEKIATVYPDLNVTWLITGKGYMIQKVTKVSKEDEQANLKFEEEQAAYKAKNKAAELIQEGLDLLNSTLKRKRK